KKNPRGTYERNLGNRDHQGRDGPDQRSIGGGGMNINDLIAEAHANAVAHGFWEEDRPFAEQIALIHSELSEALEEFRDGKGLNEIYYSCTAEGPGRQNCLCPEECPNR